MGYEVEQKRGRVLTIRMTTLAGWKQRFLLLADIHFDSVHCDRVLLKALLDEALQEGAGVLIFGDLLDYMQGKNDRRGSKSQLRPEYRDDDYVERIKEDVVAFFKPYVSILIAITEGNHDSAAKRYIEHDILQSICKTLGVPKLGYSGFIRFLFSQGNGNRCRRVLYFHHGSGGGGEVTKGTMRAQRESAKVLADVYVGGHHHTDWMIRTKRVRLNNNGFPTKEEELHISIPTMKDEYEIENDGSSSGYHIEKGREARSLGGTWLEWRWNARQPQGIGCRAYKAD